MPLIGDIIAACRRQIPDMGSMLAPPTLPMIAIAPATIAGGTLGGATVFIVITAINQWGETIASAETSVAVGGGNAVAISASGSKVPAGAIAFRIYFGQTTGLEDQYVQTDANFNAQILGFNGPNNVIIGVATVPPSTGISKSPPTRNTALQPESDGKWASAATVYDWINEALDQCMRIGNGITDITGIQAQQGVISYRAPAGFFNYTQAWYDGWPLGIVAQGQVFMRNPISGIVGYASVEHDGDTHVFSTWPQPSRTGSTANLGTAMAVGDSVANLTGGNFASANSGGSPGMGVIKVDDEIMQCSNFSATLLTGLLRGVGGTVPVAHAIGAPVTELNIRLVGRRIAPAVSPGMAAMPIRLPPGWDKALLFYVMHLARAAEQDEQASALKLKEFNDQVNIITRMSKQSTKPRQIQPNDSIEAYNVNSFGFGRLVQ